MSYQYVYDYTDYNIKDFDAYVGDNLSIITFRNYKVNRIKKFDDLYILMADSKYKKFYEKNIQLGKYYYFKAVKDKESYILKNRDKVFIDCRRCCDTSSGVGFSKNSVYYRFNIKESDYISGFSGFLELRNLQEKQNFIKYWYEGTKGKSICSKIILGIKFMTISPNHYFAIPQIDWIKIENNNLWKQKRYGEAVLDEMGLRYDMESDKIVEIKQS